jgi:maltose alpha-D-glucosyltransferase/alpha-amylase
VLVVHNFGATSQEIVLPPEAGDGESGLLVNLLSQDHSPADAKGRHTILLEPYGYRWFRIGGLDYILRRSDV